METIAHRSGNWGEEEALKYLQKLGYKILERNWRYKHLEVDIIALDQNTLVIVEVKTRKSSDYGAPEAFVSKTKQQHLVRAANFYLEKRDFHHACRFDVISIVYGGESPQLEHI